MQQENLQNAAEASQNGDAVSPRELPHGLLAVPEEVHAWLERERSKHPADAFAKYEPRLLLEWTLQYYFEESGHEVCYRPTAQGPEVLAVGFDEIYERTDAMNPDRMTGLKLWMP